jgi:hypothetical protein
MANSSLETIQVKVRRLTRSPSESQLTDADLNQYINTFVVYDFPEHLRTFNLRTTFRFWCNPYQDRYITDSSLPITNPLYNFQNRYISISPPLYVAGFQSFYSESREQFFGIYPNVNSILSIGFQGDGATTTFTGVVNLNSGPNFVNPTLSNQTAVLIQNEVLFDSVDTNGAGLSLIDVPVIDPATGNPTTNGNLYVPGMQPATPPTVITPANTINYVTGAFTITFPTAPGVGQPINSQTIPAIISMPQAMLYYNNVITIRPVPDQPYQINFEAYQRPTELLASNQSPQLEEWWQYIAYGAAKKIFEDRMDTESVAQIMPEFKQQERMCNRRTIVQYTNQRTATIYTEQTSYGPNSSGWGWGGGNF